MAGSLISNMKQIKNYHVTGPGRFEFTIFRSRHSVMNLEIEVWDYSTIPDDYSLEFGELATAKIVISVNKEGVLRLRRHSVIDGDEAMPVSKLVVAAADKVGKNIKTFYTYLDTMVQDVEKEVKAQKEAAKVSYDPAVGVVDKYDKIREVETVNI